MRARRIGFAYRLSADAIKPWLWMVSRPDWRGMEHIPPTGGFIVAANHVSHADPFQAADYLLECGRVPRFLAKRELFTTPVIGAIMRGARQIPVDRHTPDAAVALRAATEAVLAGECVLVYPEGTVTRDPAGWPMSARTGVARLALTTGAPVIPLAMWGAQELWRPRRWAMPGRRRAVLQVLAGPPVDLTAWQGAPQSAEVLRAVTEQIMREVRRMVGELRGEEPPVEVYDFRLGATRRRRT